MVAAPTSPHPHRLHCSLRYALKALYLGCLRNCDNVPCDKLEVQYTLEHMGETVALSVKALLPQAKRRGLPHAKKHYDHQGKAQYHKKGQNVHSTARCRLEVHHKPEKVDDARPLAEDELDAREVRLVHRCLHVAGHGHHQLLHSDLTAAGLGVVEKLAAASESSLMVNFECGARNKAK